METAAEGPKMATVKKNKFELHLSTKSSANYKFQQQMDTDTSTPPSPTMSVQSKKKPSVKFNPVFLERVCLFLEAQSPCELKEAHDKHLQNPPFRIICPHWPSPQETTDYYSKNILLNKKQFHVSGDNQSIKGKVMVRNLALDKSVSIRYTFNGWTTVQDVDATFFGPYLKNTAFDIYEFAMELGHGQLADRGEMRGKLEFAVRFTAGETDYHDNNNGQNYQIKIISDPLNDPWAHERPQKATTPSATQDEDEYPDDDDEEQEEELEEGQWEEKEKHSQFTNALKGYKHAKPFHLNKRQPWLGTRYDFSQSLSLAKRAPYESWATTVKANPTLITDYFLVKPISIKPVSPSPSNSTTTTDTPNSTTTTKSSTPPDTTSYSSNSAIDTKNIVSSPPSYCNASRRSSSTSAIATISAPSYSKPVYMSSTSAPPSPKASPTMPAATLSRPPLHHHSNSMSAAMSFASTVSSPLDINSSYYMDLVNKYCFYTGDADLENQQQQQHSQFPISSI
ncbi:carbohydrate-binding module family 21 protein [Mucor lusitanicus CBS 277.49]|uniref:Carbohydrate-binding module family 21 protein n=2 Tax=Mucor circinelloides f. lusitanicus TaxID=29924 RepID=A0A168H4W4_MUCCL|nr:carbohydrate-binding module family 21 protein [Mucor lusitanicus CBS 277.49]